ncbi:hypothetical protein G6F57_003601 [Rhizopus arrhizus]|uniref:Uncharacterized protein n=1 Tax=Rhizopus oryzae TaxID=64495 RepID=A0A9P6XC76_RHIOR|nr:hypothetical protein G6F22_008380 [Rhizopus arrhizus]KAG1414200.1 hypothetical protein G6F58_007077 [Rhizopus delemar]KAG0784822.1 hypothetical protein G6F21_009667 [Rhizopus arrhizus]KAG0814688.1 hypothetical protein G6F20_004570 [Rhizopus arrhizus]KAG0839911.1 hypothetical protein G6F19_002332 [Rhizopus arrhizus]
MTLDDLAAVKVIGKDGFGEPDERDGVDFWLMGCEGRSIQTRDTDTMGIHKKTLRKPVVFKKKRRFGRIRIQLDEPVIRWQRVCWHERHYVRWAFIQRVNRPSQTIQGLISRDVKPERRWIDTDGQIKRAGLGLSTVFHDTH